MKSCLINEKVSPVLEYPLYGRTVCIGRRDSDINLPDESVSRRHATLDSRTSGWLLSDAGSRNGTRVNGVSIVRRLLREGDTVSFGACDLAFRQFDTDSDAESDVDPSSRGAPDRAIPEGATRVLSTIEWAASLSTVAAAYTVSVLRGLADFAPAEASAAFRLIVADLAGLESCHRIVLHFLPGVMGQQAKWVKAGNSNSPSGVIFPEDRMFEVARTGQPMAMRNGCAIDVKADGACHAVCHPLRAGDSSAGFLYADSDDEFPPDVMQAMTGAAEAISLALSLWHTPGCPSKAKGFCSPVSPGNTEDGDIGSGSLIGRSRALQSAVRTAIRAAGSGDTTVLLRGESGTGKELFARLIYDESPRQGKPFIPVHCSSIEDSLLGSALFGHEKGAFTGAVGMKKGLFETADGGTIFLDEIGELSGDMQVKLLRVLQEGEFMRVGGVTPIRVDVRVIAATNRDLEAAMRQGVFREDLFYRLNVIAITLPPLRDRREDIPDLVGHFIGQFRNTVQTSATGITDAALDVLKRYDWPGNIRELRNIIERGLVLTEGNMLAPDDLPVELILECEVKSAEGHYTDTALGVMEQEHIKRTLAACNGNKRLAAQRLGISRSTLYEKLKEVP